MFFGIISKRAAMFVDDKIRSIVRTMVFSSCVPGSEWAAVDDKVSRLMNAAPSKVA